MAGGAEKRDDVFSIRTAADFETAEEDGDVWNENVGVLLRSRRREMRYFMAWVLFEVDRFNFGC